MQELMNTRGWLEFIGNRNIHTPGDALAYIEKIRKNPATDYWVVKLKNGNASIGLVTFIKRDYLPHPDIGFAFLPAYNGKGYAFEATQALLSKKLENAHYEKISAITLAQNDSSIHLLKNLGLHYEKEISIDNETLQVYSIASDKLLIATAVKLFFSAFDNKGQTAPLHLLHTVFIPGATITHRANEKNSIYDLQSFMAPRAKLLADGSLKNSSEYVLAEETRVTGNIAQHYAHYEKSGILNGKPFTQRGHKFFQLVKEDDGWKISALLWEDE